MRVPGLGKAWHALWDHPQVVRAREKVTEWWANLDQPPYVVEFDVPATFVLSDDQLKRFKGLLYQELVQPRPGATGILITYWKNLAVYSEHAGTYSTAISTTMPPRPRGDLLAIDAPPRSWWRRITIGWLVAAVALLAALVGNFATVGDFFGKWFEQPRVVVRMTREEVDVLVGDEFEAEGELRSDCHLVNCTVSIDDFRARSAKEGSKENDWALAKDQGLPIKQATSNRFVDIKPGATERIKIYCTPEKVGVFQVQVNGQTERRFSWWSGAFEMQRDFRIHVWQRRKDDVKEFRESDQAGKRARMVCEFMVGDEFAKGFLVEAKLIKSRLPTERKSAFRDVRFGALSFPNNPDTKEGDPQHSQSIIQLKWEAKGILPRKRSSFALYLENDNPLSDDDWRWLISQTTITFGDMPKEKESK